MSKKKAKAPQQKAVSAQTKQVAKKDRLWFIFGAVVCVCLLALAIYAVLPKTPAAQKPSTPHVDALEKGQYYYAVIDIAGYGKIKVQLDHTQAPITVDNFVKLAKSGFYDGKTFHRIIKDFMMQGGGTMIAANEPENVIGEFKANGYDNNITHKRGVISMARADDYNSASSQFFIMQVTKPHLDGNYAAFGYVVDGMGVVDSICDNIETTDDNGSVSLMDQPVIDSVTISVETPS